MAKLKIALCDDEPVWREQISKMAEEVLQEEGIDHEISLYDNSEALINAVQAGLQFHILLLDVLMPDLDGMELAAQLRGQKMKSAIIFISSNLEMALRGYEVSASRFLAKPLDRAKLREALTYCRQQTEEKKEILLPTDHGQHRISVCDIEYVEAFDRGTRFVLATETVDSKLKFGEVQSLLPKTSFVLSHRAYLVNIAHVKRIRSKEFEMKTGAIVPISKHRYDEVSRRFFAYIED